MGPIGLIEEAIEGAGVLRRLIAALPELGDRAGDISRALAEAASRGLRVNPATLDEIGRAGRRGSRWNRAALWVGAAALVAIAIALLRGTG
jgi:ubiquinone biosynthesis protein